MKKEKLKHIAKRITAFAAAVAMTAAFTFPAQVGDGIFEGFGNAIVASAATGSFTVNGGTEGTDYSYESNVLTIKTAVPVTISSTAATTDKIKVASDISANITLAGVDIDVSATENACAFEIAGDSTGSVTITLAEGTENTLKSGKGCAGLQKSGSDGSLEIKGTGKLTATGGENGAGIGCRYNWSAANITISGGTVYANGGKNGAGIGGGKNSPGSDITISGGTVTAKGGESGAGIGGGYNESGSKITISGGIVDATGGSQGAGIGGGVSGEGSDINISGGTVTAKSNGYGAGIGGGNIGEGSDITISGGTVTANGGEEGAGIGGGQNGSGSKITISGGTVTANGGDNGAGIGGGISGAGSNITISGGTVDAKGGEGGAGIGGGRNGSGSDINISGGSVYAKGGVYLSKYYGADIGGGVTKDSSGKWINGVPVTPTNGTDHVYLREIENSTGAAITINGRSYPTNHKGEEKIYAYLPAKTESIPNIVTVGNTTTYCYYDTVNGNWTEAAGAVTHTIRATAGTGGSISPEGDVSVADNDNKTFTIIPNSGYEIDTLTVDGSTVTADTSYTFRNVTEDHTISVTFKRIKYQLTVTNGSGSGSYEEGTLVTITADTPESEKKFKEWTVVSGNVTLADPTSSTTTFTMPASSVEVTATYSDNLETAGDLKVIGGTKGTDYSYESNVLTVKTEAPLTVSGTTTKDRIFVESGVSANITLAGLSIDVSATNMACAFRIADDSTGSLTITLAEGTENTLKSGMNCAGLQKNGSNGSLEIKGTGKLTAKGGGYGAGIGGGNYGSGSDIIISGGNVTATGGGSGAGIGGGYKGSGSDITISGGTVTATGGISGAGIGGGQNGSGSDIIISGGTVTANGGGGSAGIGGGDEGSCSDITISGGTVTANGGKYGAGIGGGDAGSCSDITISGGTVTANGGDYGAGIGGGWNGTGSDITISGGTVKAVAGTDTNAVGGGYLKDAVIPTDGTDNVYLREIENPTGAAITINGKTYPTNHSGEKKIYAYLPAKTASDPNKVKVGTTTTYWYYDTANSRWADVNINVNDGDDIENFVERLYLHILGRASDPEGKANHVSNLRNGETAVKVSFDFVFSSEFAELPISNEERVRRMYLTFLDRSADDAGLADWTATLDNGCSIGHIFYGFTQSGEFTELCEKYGIVRGDWTVTETRDVSSKLTAFVSRLYTKALNRSYDVDGLNNHTANYMENHDLYQLAYDFIFSPEFTEKGLSDEDFVDTMYRTFFDREGDPAGKADWLGRMKSGCSREEVLAGFVGSQECAELVAKFGI